VDQGAIHVCVLGTMCVLAEVYEEITRLSHFVSEFVSDIVNVRS